MADRSLLILAGLIAVMSLLVLLTGSKSHDGGMVGGDCGTVSPEGRDECCGRKNADTPHDTCVGSWRYDGKEGKCEYVCHGSITNFQECADAGYPVMESYPRRCRGPEGKSYTEVIDEPLDPPKPIGGDRDEHGCLTPAGYSWDGEIGACTRSWEIKDENVRRAATTAVDHVGWDDGVTVVGVEAGGCPGCYYVTVEKGSDRVEVELNNWTVRDRSITPEECRLKGGETVSTVGESGEDPCNGRYNMGEVTGLISPHVCCDAGPRPISSEEAVDVAWESECVEVGALTDRMYRNEDTRTWWIDLDAEKAGCSPACVVYEDTMTAEVNWRCTGLVA
ncbi:MAG: hypothetical protein GF416_04940 [Candidatus Altiarchaeales archaeon]|nr:hypothetical protein [Candidatus Altiarchaeales archaeon]MBD3416463.1 hypothetical protein [Candidatus Altiarchaeales archaeon]